MVTISPAACVKDQGGNQRKANAPLHCKRAFVFSLSDSEKGSLDNSKA